MTKILITGNGFDIKHDLPTQYKDFINILGHLNNLEILNFDNIYSETVNYNLLKENYSNEIIFDQNKISELKNLIKTNVWLEFFKGEFEIESWIDFEIKIEYVLKLIFSSTKYMQERIFNTIPLAIGHVRHPAKLFNNNIEILEVLGFFKIIQWERDSQEILLVERFLTQKYHFNINVKTEEIAKYLHKEIVNFKQIFNLYFEIFIVPLYDLYLKKTDKLMYRMINYHFTFNYTPTFAKIYQSSSKTFFLHGKIGDNSNLVLGINDIKDDVINKTHYIPFTKYFQKLNQSTDFQFLDVCKNDRNSGYKFFFYGHSLDPSDMEYINEVFNFVGTAVSTHSGDNKKIIIIMHNENARAKLLTNLISIRGRDDITKKMRLNILQFLLADSEELINELLSTTPNTFMDPSVH